MRTLLVEAALRATRKPGRLRECYRRMVRHKGKAKARVAVARRLAVILYQMWKKDLTYREFLQGEAQLAGVVFSSRAGDTHGIRARSAVVRFFSCCRAPVFRLSLALLLFSPPVSFRLAVLKPCIHSSHLRATGYRVQTRPQGRGGLPNHCFGP